MSNRFVNMAGPRPAPPTDNGHRVDPTTHPRFFELTDEQVRRVERGESVEIPEQREDPGTSNIEYVPTQEIDLSVEAEALSSTASEETEVDVSDLEKFLNSGGGEQPPVEEKKPEPVQAPEEEEEEEEPEPEPEVKEEPPEKAEVLTEKASSGERPAEDYTVSEFPDAIRSYKRKSYTWTISEEVLREITEWKGNKPMEKKAFGIILGARPLEMSASSKNDIMTIVDELWKKTGRDITLFLMELGANTPHTVMEVDKTEDLIRGLGYLGPVFMVNTTEDGTQTLFVFNSISLKQNRASGYEFDPNKEEMMKISWYLEKDDDLSLATLAAQPTCSSYFVVDARSRFVD